MATGPAPSSRRKASSSRSTFTPATNIGFCAGATDKAQKIQVTVFDENGAQVSTETYEDGTKAGAGFLPTISGAYIVRIQELEGTPASFCLLYTYK